MEVSCFPITIKNTKPVWMYDVSVELVVGEIKPLLNKDGSDPQDKAYCRQLVRLAAEKSGNFGGDDKLAYVYDGLSCFYASHEIVDQDVTVEKGEFTEKLKNAYRHDIVVRISRTATNHELYIHTPPDKMPIDQFSEFKRFLSLVVCQYALDCERYSVLDHGRLFSTDNAKAIQLNGAIEIRPGMSKGIRLLDDGKGVKPAFEIDYCASAFYRAVTLADTLNDFRDPVEANEFLRKVRVHPDYNPHRSLRFVEFSKDTPSSHKFQLRDGSWTTVLDYFKNVRKEDVMPNLPLVSVNPKTAGFFPAERISIVPHQKVCIERLNSRLADALHSRNAVLPHVRHQHIVDIIRSLNLSEANPILKAFGVSVQSSFSSIPASKIWRPSVQMCGTVSVPKDDGSFRNKFFKYLVPGTVAKWAVFYADHGVHLDTVKILVKRLREEAENKGLILPAPIVIQSCDMDAKRFMEKTFVNIKNLTGVSYILFIDPKDASSTHNMVKLVENRYKIVTQHLALVQACVEGNQRMILENVLNKMNLKLGGVNYAPKFTEEAAELALDKGTFVIGYQTAHCKMVTERVFTEGNVTMLEPSVLAFTGNYSSNANLFVGNWLYQNVEHEMVDVKTLEDQFHHSLSLLAKKRPADAKPKIIVVFRDGISEPRYDEFSGIELQALKNACARIAPSWKPKFILIVTTKEHDTRIFQRVNNKIENPPPGCSIVLRPGKEILTTPQKAIKGTAQPIKITLVKNETSVSFLTIKNFIHGLSYSHQIVCSPTGVVEPIYQADLLAKRGLSSLKALKDYCPTQVPRLSNQQYDINKLNERLSMTGSRLELIRFTA